MSDDGTNKKYQTLNYYHGIQKLNDLRIEIIKNRGYINCVATLSYVYCLELVYLQELWSCEIPVSNLLPLGTETVLW